MLETEYQINLNLSTREYTAKGTTTYRIVILFAYINQFDSLYRSGTSAHTREVAKYVRHYIDI